MVWPPAALIRPSRRKVDYAFGNGDPGGCPWQTRGTPPSARSPPSTGITSFTASRPRYPVWPHQRQPTGRQTSPAPARIHRPVEPREVRVRRGVGLLAPLAQPACEALGEDAVDRRPDQERLDAHLDEAGDGAGCVVGVQRREDQVAGERRLDGDCAVGRSRTSPIRTTSGSGRRIAGSTAANVSPALWFTCTWVTPTNRYSTGSSTVMILISGVLISARVAYSVVDFPGPGRTGDEHHAVRLAERPRVSGVGRRRRSRAS